MFALTRVAIDARQAVLTDRLGKQSRFVESSGVSTAAQAAIVPLPRTTKAGHAIVAIAPAGETIPNGGLAVLDAVAATIADSLHLQAAENARAESAVKSKVMSAVSHEMRNPLNSILGFTSLVLGAPGSTLDEKQRRQLGHVQTSANNMLGLVNNYLDLAKVRSGAIAFQYETVKVEPLLADLLTAMQPMAAERKVAIRSSIKSDAQARVDPTRLRQIAGNLLSNAVKFTPAGGCVTLRARSDKDWSSDHRERHRRRHSQGPAEAPVHGVFEDRGGNDVREQGHGARTDGDHGLPGRDGRPDQGLQQAGSRLDVRDPAAARGWTREEGRPRMTSPPCVVVVGNSSEGRDRIQCMLDGEPWRIVGAPDGQTVIDLVRRHSADLVLMESADGRHGRFRGLAGGSGSTARTGFCRSS